MTPLQSVKALVNLAEDQYDSADLRRVVDQATLRVDLLQLTAHPGIYSGELEYRTFTSEFTDWVDDVIFHDGGYNLIVPTESDNRAGRWVFDSEPVRPVRISGSSVDIYEAGANLLDEIANSTGDDIISFSGQNGAFATTSKTNNYLKLSSSLRNRQRLSTFVLPRGDKPG